MENEAGGKVNGKKREDGVKKAKKGTGWDRSRRWEGRENKAPCFLHGAKVFLFDIFRLFVNNFLSPFIGHVGEFFVDDVHSFAGRYFSEEDKQIRQFAI